MMQMTEAKTEPTFDLSDEELKRFHEQGYIGPFTLWSPEEMNARWSKVRRQLFDRSHAAYPIDEAISGANNIANYDRHLDVPYLGEHICRPEIVHRVRSILGWDVLCWRTEFFPKNPGDSGTGWHQVETYAIGETITGMLEATEHSPGSPMELTCWVAFTEATRENGCMKLIPGSHRQWRYDERAPMRWNGRARDNGFFGYNYDDIKIDETWDPDQEQVDHVEMRPGEFIIFTARTIHGSNPNSSNRQRMGFAIRTVPTHVRVYGDMNRFDEFGHHFELDKHGCVLVGGHDDYGHNRIRRENAWGVPFRPLPSLAG